MTVPTIAESPIPPLPEPAEPVAITWHGSPWSLAGLGLLNMLLSVATLGIYSFWGRTEARRRIWSMVRMNGEPFAYTGTGKELFLGYIIVFFIITVPTILSFSVIPYVAIWLLGPVAGPIVGALFVVGYMVFLYLLVGTAVYRAMRYRLTRTQWRGIRGAVVGSHWTYGWHYFWTMIANYFAMGWMTPWRSNLLHRQLTNDMRFGETAFKYKGRAGSLYPPFVLAWVGGIIALAIVIGGTILITWSRIQAGIESTTTGQPPTPEPLGYGELASIYGLYGLAFFVLLVFGANYFARTLNYFTNFTSFAGTAGFQLKASALSLLWQTVSNFLLMIFSLGILSPVAQARWIRYVVDRLEITGGVNFTAVNQSKAALGKRGEGMATAFDVDAFS
ncbi:MAG: DUF898 family protein [Hyphomicrobiaceae bacterium]